MKNKIIILLISILLFNGGPVFPQTIKQSVQNALRNNEGLKSQKALVKNSFQSFSIESGKLLPSLSLNGSGTRTSNFKKNQNSDSYSISLSSSYILFDFGSQSFKRKSSFYLKEAAKFSLEKYENELIFSVIKTHLELFKAIKIVELYKNSLENRRQQFLAAKNRFDLGEATKSDLLRSKASISGAEAQLKIGQANVKKFEEKYKTLVGEAPDTPKFNLKGIIQPASLKNSIRAGLENDVTLRILRLEEAALKEELRSVEKSRLPNLSLSGSLTYGDSETFGNNYSTGSISLNSNFILYSGGQKRAQVEIASNNLTAKVIDISVRKNSLQRDITTKWLDLTSLTSSAVAKQEETNALKELYENVFEEWKLGGKTSLDTDQAYQNLLNAEVELVSTSVDILIAKFDLLSEIGTLRKDLKLL